eukprot:354782-Chlamydomonas_euryale.AAC.2
MSADLLTDDACMHRLLPSLGQTHLPVHPPTAAASPKTVPSHTFLHPWCCRAATASRPSWRHAAAAAAAAASLQLLGAPMASAEFRLPPIDSGTVPLGGGKRVPPAADRQRYGTAGWGEESSACRRSTAVWYSWREGWKFCLPSIDSGTIQLGGREEVPPAVNRQQHGTAGRSSAVTLVDEGPWSLQTGKTGPRLTHGRGSLACDCCC